MPTALIIGDSHVDGGALGSALQVRLQALGYTVTRAGVGATSARSWTKPPPKVCRPDKSKCVELADLPHNTDLLVISLGTNDAANCAAGGYNPTTYNAETVQRISQLATEFGAARTIWVGPPWQRGSVKWYTQPAMDALYAAAELSPPSGVELFDSRPVTRETVQAGSGDGVHPGTQAATAWAGAICQATTSPPSGFSWMVPALVTVGIAAIIWHRRRKRQK